MAFDINHCTFSGKVLDITQIQTKTGTPMTSFRIQCWKEQIRCVGFKEMAGQMLTFHDGDRVEIFGKIQSNNWKKDGTKVYSYQVIVDGIKEEGQPAKPEPVTRPQQHSNDHPADTWGGDKPEDYAVQPNTPF